MCEAEILCWRLMRDSRDINGYAFALGALAHYAADNDGHPMGTNRAVPILYPKLKKKYGDSVTYEEDKMAHVKTEFGFDVLEVARGRYAPDGYHDFIGFGVAAPLLEQAFQETYGLDLKSVLSERRPGARFLPSRRQPASSQGDAHRLEPEEKRHHEGSARHDEKEVSLQSFSRQLSNKLGKPISAAHLWGEISRLSGSGFSRRFGPLKVLQLGTPTPETERMFEASFNATLDRYRQLLGQVGTDQLRLPNDNFDTGEVSGPRTISPRR